MMSTTTHRVESYSSLRIRFNQACIAGMTCLTAGGISAAAVSGWLRVAILVGMAPVTVWAVRRGFRLNFVATPKGIVIRNYWRSHAIDWEQITDVGVGSAMMGVLPQPAFSFRLRGGKTVVAQSTPFHDEAQWGVLYDLEKIAPSHVKFHRPYE